MMLPPFFDLLLIAGLAEAAVDVAGGGLARRDGTAPALPHDPNTTPYCTWWTDLTEATPCSSLLSSNFITLEEFLRWNPSVSADCGNLQVGSSYCVEAANEPPPGQSSSTKKASSTSTASPTKPPSTSSSRTATTTQPPTSTTPANGIETPSPTQPKIVDNCDKFYRVWPGDTCEAIAIVFQISLAQFLEWNPSAGSDCSGLWADAYACVSVIGHPPSTTLKTTTTTTPGNGISTPTPTLPGMVNNCDSFYRVKSGDTCASVASKSGISVSQLTSWNPNVGSSCTGLWLDYYICISIIGHTPTNPGNGIATPTPIQSGMTPNCKSFHFIRAGEDCSAIASKYKITVANFISWNPAVGNSCSGLWANTYACVGVL